MKVELSKDVIMKAEAYWNEEGVPMLRQPNDNDKILILGYSIGQDTEVLLTREVESEDYGDAAAEAAHIVDEYLPESFNFEGKVIAKLSTGFYDGYSEWYSEITFSKIWHVTLLQEWLDSKNAGICIKLGKKFLDSKMIDEHVARASYSFVPPERYAAFKKMSIQNAIRSFVAEYLKTYDELPIGKFLIDGTDVTFR